MTGLSSRPAPLDQAHGLRRLFAHARVRFDYLVPQLRLPENQRRRAVVEILKSLVPQAPARS